VTITEFPLSNPGAPYKIAAGPDGALWFTETVSNARIGRITTSGVITESPIATNSSPSGIVTGPDGGVWFAQDTPANLGASRSN